MQNMWVRSLGWEDPLEKEMAAPSSIPAWGIPWTGQPACCASWGCKRVGRDLVNKQQQPTPKRLLHAGASTETNPPVGALCTC